jgi:hypothetical protein
MANRIALASGVGNWSKRVISSGQEVARYARLSFIVRAFLPTPQQNG